VLMSLLLGYDRYSDDLFSSSILESIMLTGALLLTGWCWTIHADKEERDQRRDQFRLLLLTCFVSGTPIIILFAFVANAAYGWLFICLAVFLWLKPSPTIKHRALALGLSFALFPLYSTPAMLLAILTLVFAAFDPRTFR